MRGRPALARIALDFADGHRRHGGSAVGRVRVEGCKILSRWLAAQCRKVVLWRMRLNWPSRVVVVGRGEVRGGVAWKLLVLSAAQKVQVRGERA